MSAETPVLAIHGVNNRHRRSFEQRIAFFNDTLNEGQGGIRWRLYPVWWGERGSKDEHVGVTIPRPDFGRALGTDEAHQMWPQVDDSRPTNVTFERFLLTLESHLKDRARTQGLDASSRMPRREMIESHWDRTVALKFADDDVLDAVGQRAAQAAVLAMDEGEDVEAGVTQIIIEEDDGLLERWAAKLNLASRGMLIQWVSRFFGDVVVYSGDAVERPRPPTPNIPSSLNETLSDVRNRTGVEWGTADHPIPVVAHSLGSLVVFDAIGRKHDPLVVSALITFGSQISWFHAIGARVGWPDFTGAPLSVPRERIKRWTNIWNPADPLAFAMEPVFGGTGDGHAQVTDIQGPTTIRDFHGMYWDDAVVAGHIRRALMASND